MKKIICIIGIAGFFVCLLLMYTTDLGENGLRKHDADFEMLDTRFHYTTGDVNEAFEDLGEGGITAYHSFWMLDYVFIACFLVVMIAITNKAAKRGRVRKVLLTFAIARAGFDIIENNLLLHLSNIYPVHNDSLATLCSWVTTSKFAALYLWPEA